jgi:hypothetical protein
VSSVRSSRTVYSCTETFDVDTVLLVEFMGMDA